MFFDQQEFDIRCEWGYEGVIHLAPHSDVVVIVDILSFSTCVAIAVNNGAVVYPYRWKIDSAVSYAETHHAILASFLRDQSGYSLSPASLLNIPSGTRLVLPSPNGSTLSLAMGSVPTFAGCFRNVGAIAEAVTKIGKRITVIPAGERWENGTLRAAIEDLVGAGAIIHQLAGRRSPEAQLAENAFLAIQPNLREHLINCGSAKELIGKGFRADVMLSLEFNVSKAVPILIDGAYRPG